MLKTKATILVVDDTEQNVRLLAHVLKKEGYEILAAFSGEDALKMVEKKKPDIILLDVMMPAMNGFEVCQKLKQNVDTKDIPVVFLSALSETDSKIKGFSVGGVDYITKPFQRDEVLSRIDLHIKLKKLQDELETTTCQLQDLEQKNGKLNEKNSEFIRVVGHDIMNLVVGIMGAMEILKDSNNAVSAERRDKLYGMIEDSGKKLRDTVNKLLEKEKV